MDCIGIAPHASPYYTFSLGLNHHHLSYVSCTMHLPYYNYGKILLHIFLSLLITPFSDSIDILLVSYVLVWWIVVIM